MRKRRSWGVAISISTATLALVWLGVSASADPQGPPQYRPLVGVGADTTQGVMNAMSDVITGGPNNSKMIASENAFGTPSLTVKDPSVSPLCTVTRPFESGGGVSALEQSMARGDGCFQFARSSTTNQSNYAPQDLTFIPFAQDAVSYAVGSNTQVPRQLDVATLAAIYTCQNGFTTPKPILPPWGSGTRRIFLQYLGLTDSINFTELHPCVKETAPSGQVVSELDLRGLSDPWSLMPVSVADYLAQSNQAVQDLRSNAVLGTVGQVLPETTAYSVSFAIRQDSTYFNRSMTSAQLAAAYTCQDGTAVKPLLPPYGDPTRTAFLQALGLTDSQGFTTAHPCVQQIAAANDGRQLSDQNSIMPYSVPVYLSQIFQQNVQDLSGGSVLGLMNGLPPLTVNPNAPMVHNVYNVIPTSDVLVDTNAAPYWETFVGSNSAICSHSDLIRNFGFNPIAGCGDVSLKIGP